MFGSGRPKKDAKAVKVKKEKVSMSAEELMKWEKRLKNKETKLKKMQEEMKLKTKSIVPKASSTKTPSYSEFIVPKSSAKSSNFHSIFNDLDHVFKPMSLMIEFPDVNQMMEQHYESLKKSKGVKSNNYYRSVNMQTLNDREALIEINENGKVKKMVVPLSQVHNYV